VAPPSTLPLDAVVLKLLESERPTKPIAPATGLRTSLDRFGAEADMGYRENGRLRLLAAPGMLTGYLGTNTLLIGVGIEDPYVVVGHSYGPLSTQEGSESRRGGVDGYGTGG
jgi:hypothetical protein